MHFLNSVLSSSYAMYAYGTMCFVLLYSIYTAAGSKDLINAIRKEHSRLIDTKSPDNINRSLLVNVFINGNGKNIDLLQAYERALRRTFRPHEARLVMIERVAPTTGLAFTTLGLVLGIDENGSASEINAILSGALGTTFLGALCLIVAYVFLLKTDRAIAELLDDAEPIIHELEYQNKS